MLRVALVGVALLALGPACAPGSGPHDGGEDAGPPPEPVFPADYQASYIEARNCRPSHEHDLRYIRVFVEPQAFGVYQTYQGDYPVGSTLVKPEYDDEGCQSLLGYSAMQKLAPGALPLGGDWLWQKLDADRAVMEEGAPIRCVDCHQYHCSPPDGHDLTCAEEIGP